MGVTELGEAFAICRKTECAVAQNRATVVPSGNDHGYSVPEDNRCLVAGLPRQMNQRKWRLGFDGLDRKVASNVPNPR